VSPSRGAKHTAHAEERTQPHGTISATYNWSPATVCRDELHPAVEQLPKDRLRVAAELLEAPTLHDERVDVKGRGIVLNEPPVVAYDATFRRCDWVANSHVASD